jgi:hypothetical protein
MKERIKVPMAPKAIRSKGFWKEIKWHLFLAKVNVEYWWAMRQERKQLKKYCKKGFHSLSQGHWTYLSGKTFLSVRYLYCRICQTKFFLTEKDKDDYITITKNEQETLFKFFDSAVNKGGNKNGKHKDKR